MSWFRSRISKPGDPYCRALRIPCIFLSCESEVSLARGCRPLAWAFALRNGEQCGFGWKCLAAQAVGHREGSTGVELRSEAGSSAFGSRHDRSSSIDRSLLPVADQHVAAGRRELWTIFLEAGQNGQVALIHQLATETVDGGRASLLPLVRCAMHKD